MLIVVDAKYFVRKSLPNCLHVLEIKQNLPETLEAG